MRKISQFSYIVFPKPYTHEKVQSLLEKASAKLGFSVGLNAYQAVVERRDEVSEAIKEVGGLVLLQPKMNEMARVYDIKIKSGVDDVMDIQLRSNENYQGLVFDGRFYDKKRWENMEKLSNQIILI